MALTKVGAGVLNIDDLYGFRNRIINGDMRISQRGTSFSLTVGAYTLDRFRFNQSIIGSTIQPVVSQVTDAPAGFTHSLEYVNTNAATPTGTNQAAIETRIEGNNIADLSWGTADAKAVTLSFWVKSSLTGNFGGSFANGNSDRSYTYIYSINSVNTWEYKTVIIPGDTTGTWRSDTGPGLRVRFCFGAGPDRLAAAGAWVSDNIVGATGQVQLVETAGATWQITGVQLEKGTVATPFERRPFGTELSLCQRYYFKIQSEGTNTYMGTGFATTTTSAYMMTSFPTEMRISPAALEQSGTAGDYRVRYLNTNLTSTSVPSFEGSSKTLAITNFIAGASLTAGQGMMVRGVTANAFLAWSAEL
jgi:hypothetical protein